jgi:transposase
LKPKSVKAVDFAKFLESLPPGRPVILDNAAIHRSRIVRDTAIDRNIKLTFIPPYSPWFNPIEFAFSEVKRSTRRAMVGNSLDELSRVVRKRLAQGVAANAYFEHCTRILCDMRLQIQHAQVPEVL